MNEPSASQRDPQKPDRKKLLRELKRQVAVRDGLLRLLHREIANYEEIEDNRNALIEQLVFERKSLLQAQAQRQQEFEETRAVLERENAALAEQLSHSAETTDGLKTTSCALAVKVETTRGRRATMENELEKLQAEQEHAMQTAQQRAEVAQEEVQKTERRLQQEEADLQDRIEECRRAVAAGHDNLEAKQQAYEAKKTAQEKRLVEKMADLDARLATVADLREQNAGLQAQVDEVEEHHQQLRAKIRTLRLQLVTLTRHGEPSVAKNATPGEPGDARRQNDRHSQRLDNGQHQDSHDHAQQDEAMPDATRDLRSQKTRPASKGEDEPCRAQQVLRWAESKHHGEGTGKIDSLAAFERALGRGAKVGLTAKFDVGEFTGPIDRQVAALVDVAETLDEMAVLAPAALRQSLPRLLYRFYQRGQIVLA